VSIKFLLDQIGKINLADDLSEEQLVAIGSRCKRQYDEDLASMTDWIEGNTKGIELMRQEYAGKSFPWEGASNYKDPKLTEAATLFGDKASLELLRAKDLVSSAIIGRDPEKKKKAISLRVIEAMNYQINYDMDGWRDDQSKMFYCLPNTGAVFKKVVFDSLEKTCESVVITFPDFVVNQATKSMVKCRSFTHLLQDISENDIEVRVNCGKWLDPRPQKPEDYDKQGDQGSNEQQKVVDSIDNPMAFGEQHTYFDLDEDGYEEPYIITFRISDGKVVRILPRYDERSIIVKYGEKDDEQYLPVQEVLEMEKEAQGKEFGGMLAKLIGVTPPEIDPDVYELVKVVPFQNIVKYGFIPAPDNTFLDLGYAHLLGAITQNINTTTNQINDRGTLNNLGGGFLAKEFRAKQGVLRFRMGQYMQTEVPADKLAKGIFPQPLQSADATSYQMCKDMQERSNAFLAVTDISGKLQATTAPTTALAIIQEAIIPTTALFARILRATSREFQILYRINQRTFPKRKYQKILDDESADPQIDFNYDGLDIIPTANAEMSSKMHRIQTAQLEMETMPLVLQAGGNPAPILKNFYDAIGSELVDEIFPEEGSMSPEDKAMQQQMLKAQEQANKIAEMQLQILSREQDRLDLETREKVKKMEREIEQIAAEIMETMAKTIKLGEEAETESLKNGITLYVEHLRTQAKAVGALGDVNARPIALPQLPQTTNNQRAF
jgi:chaperonin GroES